MPNIHDMTANLPVVQRAQLALNSEAVEAEFRELAAQSQAITAIVDQVSYDECHGARMRLVKARTTTVQRGKGAREDAQAYAKSVIAEEKRLLAILDPEERRLTALEDAHDRIERDRIQAEIDRCTQISDAIQALNMIPATMAGKSAAELAKRIEALKAYDVTEWSQDQTTAAQVAHGRALQALQQLHAGAVAQEQAQAAEQATIAQERAELATLRAEKEERLARYVPLLAHEATSLAPVVTLKASGKAIPSDTDIIHAVALVFQVDDETALEWLCAMFAKRAA